MIQDRRSRRSHVLLKANLELPRKSLPVMLHNISEDGALISGFELPEEGDRVLFHRQGLCVPSRIAWVHQGQAGVEFDYPLFPRELLRHTPPGQPRKPVVLRPRRWRPPESPAAAECAVGAD